MWVSLTLILTIGKAGRALGQLPWQGAHPAAMSGNLTAYLGHDPESAALPATWSYDLEKLTVRRI